MNTNSDLFWSTYASSYNALQLFVDIYRDLLLRTVEALKPYRAIEDFGCGTGRLEVALANHGVSVRAYEKNLVMLHYAQSNITELAKSKILLEQADIASEEIYKNRSLLSPAAAAINVSYNLPDDITFFKRVCSILEPEGVLVVSNPLPHATGRAMNAHIESSLANAGMDKLFPLEFNQLKTGNERIADLHMHHKDSLEQISNKLLDAGFSTIVTGDEDAFAGLNYFVVARK